jgi:DNA-binding response OmpR family regulator
MCRVLIIDEEEAICSMLLNALSRDYIEAEIATSGHDGLHKFNQEHFDIVITDIIMPGMDGNSIAHQIRNSDKSHTPIIGISGTAWLLDKREFDVIFEKPCSIRSLVSAVKNLTATSYRAVA